MNGRKLFLLIIVLVEWISLIVQFILHLQTVNADFVEAIIRFFSFFTILTNILVGIIMTAHLFTSQNRQKKFLSGESVHAATSMYITVVGLVYNLTLRHLWASGGLQAILHDLLHSVIPVLMIIYWWKFADAKRLAYQTIPAWLIYPAVYALFILTRGSFSGWYPYPFMNVLKLGYPQVLINSGYLLLTFLFFSFSFIFFGKRK